MKHGNEVIDTLITIMESISLTVAWDDDEKRCNTMGWKPCFTGQDPRRQGCHEVPEIEHSEMVSPLAILIGGIRKRKKHNATVQLRNRELS